MCLDSHVQLLRVLIQARLARSGYQPNIDVALKKFEEHASHNAEVDPNFRPVIYGWYRISATVYLPSNMQL